MAAAGEDARRSLGARGEQAAADYLTEQGWEVLERNWRTATGELDLIVGREEERYGEPIWSVVIVEVKSRRVGAKLAPEVSVTRAKRRKIVALARRWRAAQPRELVERMAIRFDIIAVGVGWQDRPTEVEHFPHAFDGEGRLL